MKLFLLVVLILANGLFALVEIAFVSAKRSRLEEMSLKGSAGARIALQLLGQPERFFSAVQLGVTLIGVINGALGALFYAGPLAAAIARAPALAPLAHEIAAAVVVLAITYLSIVLGELVPKTIALRAPERIAAASAPAIRLIATLAAPAVAVLELSTRVMVRALRIGTAKQEQTSRTEEILSLVRLAAARREISGDQERIFSRTLGLSTLRAADIMIGRGEMRTLSTSMSLAEALIEAHKHHHTRFPLVDGDKVIGYVNFKDIVSALQLNPSDPSLKGIKRPIMTVAAGDSVAELLPRLINQHQHVAVVADASGAIVGMVSMEDIVETIVGDIYDEYDLLPSFVYPITATRYLVGGGLKVNALRDKLGLPLPQLDEPVSRWLAQIAQQPPKVEDRIVFGDLVFVPRRISRSEIREVIVERSERSEARQIDGSP